MSVVEVNNLKKVYPLYSSKLDKLKEAFSLSEKKYHRDFYALKGISFQVEKGECVGIIGLNGSGKSTLLKILTEVIQPTEGTAAVHGKTAALLELGAGFNPEYTGMENIYLNTMLMGYTREETKAHLQDILDFADIGEFIHQPVKTYSSGMFVRLAFAIAIMVQPDVLIVDEALSVGDVFFQQKCYAKITEFAQKSTVLIVSHDLNAITKFCKRIIVMNQGEIMFDGEPKEAVIRYYKIKQGVLNPLELTEDTGESSIKEEALEKYRVPDEEQYSGRMDAVIEKYYYQIQGTEFGEISAEGKILDVSMFVRAKRRIENLIVGYQVRDKFGNEVFGETSLTSFGGYSLNEGCSFIRFQVVWPEIREGDYFITLGIGEGPEVLKQVEQCWIHNVIHLNNTTYGKLIYGSFNIPMKRFEIESAEGEE